MKRTLYYVVVAFLVNTAFVSAAIVDWEDSFVINVTDQNVRWRKKIILPVGTTTIQSVTTNVDVYLHHDVTLIASESGTSTLVFDAGVGTIITVHIDRKLRFHTSPINDNELIIQWIGEGEVIFDIIQDQE